MASEIKANKLSPATGTALTIGDSGDTVSIDANISGDLIVDTDTLYVDSTNNKVGIGTSSPASTLQVGDQSTTSNTLITVESANNTLAGIDLMGDLGGSKGFRVKYEGNGNYFAIEDNTSSVLTERMRIDSSGNLLVADTTNVGTADHKISIQKNATGRCLGLGTTLTTATILMSFVNGNGTVGTIQTNGTGTSYVTSSDYRLKEDWQPMSGSIDRVKALNPVNFAWKVDGSRADGFLAHEVQEVVSEAISGTKDEMRTEEYEVTPAVFNDEGVETAAAVMGTREVPEYQGIDQSKLVPLLTSALQEAVAKIESLEARVAVLEAN